eukprot:m.248350 g.248350  ORF g.248350 m.248350 type:complete len:323 (-) comp19504_c0_seq1:800-1768(-)
MSSANAYFFAPRDSSSWYSWCSAAYRSTDAAYCAQRRSDNRDCAEASDGLLTASRAALTAVIEATIPAMAVRRCAAAAVAPPRAPARDALPAAFVLLLPCPPPRALESRRTALPRWREVDADDAATGGCTTAVLTRAAGVSRRAVSVLVVAATAIGFERAGGDGAALAFSDSATARRASWSTSSSSSSSDDEDVADAGDVVRGGAQDVLLFVCNVNRTRLRSMPSLPQSPTSESSSSSSSIEVFAGLLPSNRFVDGACEFGLFFRAATTCVLGTLLVALAGRVFVAVEPALLMLCIREVAADVVDVVLSSATTSRCLPRSIS